MVDIALDELLGLTASKLAQRVADAPVVIVRSQEIDHAGEAGFDRQARRGRRRSASGSPCATGTGAAAGAATTSRTGD